MVGALIETFFDAYLRPRRSVRRLIDAGHGSDVAFLLVLLGYVLREIFILLTPGAIPGGGAVSLTGLMIDLIEAYATFGLLVVAIYHLGRMFGGVGSFAQTVAAVAWYMLVVSLLTPLAVPASVSFMQAVQAASGQSGGQAAGQVAVPAWSVVVMAVTSGISMWLLASCVAELHRFQRTWQVLLVMVGLSTGVAIIATTLLQHLL